MKFIHTEYKLSFKLRDLNPRSRPAVNRISLVWQFVNIQGNVLKYYIGLHENETLKEWKKNVYRNFRIFSAESPFPHCFCKLINCQKS